MLPSFIILIKILLVQKFMKLHEIMTLKKHFWRILEESKKKHDIQTNHIGTIIPSRQFLVASAAEQFLPASTVESTVNNKRPVEVSCRNDERSSIAADSVSVSYPFKDAHLWIDRPPSQLPCYRPRFLQKRPHCETNPQVFGT